MQYLIDNSIFRWLLALVSYVIAEPNMRAIIQNLAATAIWALGRISCKGLRFLRLTGRAPAEESSEVSDCTDDLKEVMLAAIDALSKRGGELTIKTQIPNQKTELTIKLT